MTLRWLDATADGVWRFVPHVAHAALNPWRRLVAVAGAGRDEAAWRYAERLVQVLDLDEGRELAALDDDAPVQSLTWTSPDHLLVIRRGFSHSELTLHELPDGGPVSLATSLALRHDAPRVERSSDGSRLMVVDGDAFQGVHAAVAHVLAAASLDPLAAIPLPERRRGFPRMHPDGTRVALLVEDGLMRVLVAPVGPPDPPRTLLSLRGRGYGPWWVDGRSLVLGLGGPREPRNRVAIVECDAGFREAQVRAAYAPEPPRGRRLYPLQLHPDRDRLLVGFLARNDHAPGRGSHLEVLRLSDGLRTPLGPLAANAVACWAADAVALVDVSRSVAVVTPGTPERTVTVPLPESHGAEYMFLDAGGAGQIVMTRSRHPGGETLTFVDVAALLGH